MKKFKEYFKSIHKHGINKNWKCLRNVEKQFFWPKYRIFRSLIHSNRLTKYNTLAGECARIDSVIYEFCGTVGFCYEIWLILEFWLVSKKYLVLENKFLNVVAKLCISLQFVYGSVCICSPSPQFIIHQSPHSKLPRLKYDIESSIILCLRYVLSKVPDTHNTYITSTVDYSGHHTSCGKREKLRGKIPKDFWCTYCTYIHVK